MAPRSRRIAQLVAAIALSFGIGYLVAPASARARVDDQFLIFLGVAALVLLVPWDELTSLKAGPIEAIWQQPQVAGAARGIRGAHNRKLTRLFQSLSVEIATIEGSRVLWIDDSPARVLGERRLLRSLGVDVVTARSSGEALDSLARDSDFDLVITDLQRRGSSYKQVPTGGAIVDEQPVADEPGVVRVIKEDGTTLYDIHEGANFVAGRLRTHEDETVREIPVIFYASYDMPRLRRYTAFLGDDVWALTNSIYSLFAAAIEALAERREKPSAVDALGMKQPTVASKEPTAAPDGVLARQA